jgi:hypothetical protein
MTENRQNRQLVSALIDVQDGLDEIKANLLLIDIARQYLVNNPEKVEILICTYLDTEPIKRLTELIKIIEQTRENLVSVL